MSKRIQGACLTGLIAVIGLVFLAACGGQDEAADTDPGPVHVHGLGLNPADGSLFVATHTGLYRLEEDSPTAARVGGRLQDTMGFAVVGPDRFIGSGHPDLRDDLPPLLGLIRSTDAGVSWEPISLLGEADFHVLRANGERIVGFDATGGRLMVSDDAGETWRTLEAPPGLTDIVIQPDRPEHWIASAEGGLYVSADSGLRWRLLAAGSPPAGSLLTWPEPQSLYAMTSTGKVVVSGDAGATWRSSGAAGGEPAALTAVDGDSLIVALHDGALRRSDDAGGTWVEGAWQAPF